MIKMMLNGLLLVVAVALVQVNGRLGGTGGHGQEKLKDTIVPGSGYGCGMEFGCTEADGENCREYVIRPEIRRFTIKNSKKFFGTEMDVDFITRTFSMGEGDFNSDYLTSVCGKYSNDDWILGPCLEMIPGSQVYIRVENMMDENNVTVDLISNQAPNPMEYVNSKEKYGVLDGFRYYNKKAQSPEAYGVPSDVWKPGQQWNETVAAKTNLPEWAKENSPGADVSFNATNIHLHGMEAVPHLFYPMGTSNEAADWVDVRPKSQLVDPTHDNCYTYNFTIPETHPSGATYWYHTHRHGSVAIQTWSGMAGLVLLPGPNDEILKTEYNVTSDNLFVIWDPHVALNNETNTVQVGTFLDNQNTEYVQAPFLVNNEYQPNFDLEVNQTARFRVLCATTENFCGFRFIRLDDESQLDEICNYGKSGLPFYNIGSDGIMFNQSYEKDMLVLAGGLREEILVQFEESGTYVVCQQGLDTVQFYDTGPANQTLATITVISPSDSSSSSRKTNLTNMTLIPGVPKEEDITYENIKAQKNMVFGMETDQSEMPLPHFSINGNKYTVHGGPNEVMTVGDAEEIVIFNYQLTNHPFHIHVNSFQVKEVITAFKQGSEFSNYLVNQANHNPWRDTVIVPAQGAVRLWYRPQVSFVGKTVYHCHFLAHEDTGMISNFVISFNATQCQDANQETRNSCEIVKGSNFLPNHVSSTTLI